MSLDFIQSLVVYLLELFEGNTELLDFSRLVRSLR